MLIVPSIIHSPLHSVQIISNTSHAGQGGPDDIAASAGFLKAAFWKSLANIISLFEQIVCFGSSDYIKKKKRCVLSGYTVSPTLALAS